VSIEPERAVLAIEDLRNKHRSAGDQTPAVIGVVRNSLPRAVLEDIGRVERGVAQRPLRLSADLIRPALGTDVDHRADAVSRTRIEGGGLYFEFCNRGGGRDEA